MRFMLLIHGDETAVLNASPDTVTTMSSEYAAYGEAMKKAGVIIGGDRLHPTTTAAQVTVRNGKTDVLDGPYADTKEQFGGYYMIEVPDLDQAIAWAARCPGAQHGTIEVRQIWEMSTM